MKYLIRLFTIIIGCLLTFYIMGCGDTKLNNSAPIIERFIFPAEFNPGDVLEFQIFASDVDGDILGYTWVVNHEELEFTGTFLRWTAPEDVEFVEVRVFVSDGTTRTTVLETIPIKEVVLPVVPPVVEFDTVPDPPLNRIVPGKGAFGIKLGDPFEKVEAIHGKPDEPPTQSGYFSYFDKGFAGFLVIGVSGRVKNLFLYRLNKAKTAGGNGIGSSLDSVEREFGFAQKITEDRFEVGVFNYWYSKRGIEFEIDEDEKVASIHIFERK